MADLRHIRAAAEVLRAVNHPLRQQILKLLAKKGSLVVSEIYGKLALEQSVASTHLATLRRAGLVKVQQAGKFRYYKFVPERLEEIAQFSEKLTKNHHGD